MTNKEMQKTMQFILEQQAQFVVNIQKLEEEQTKAAARMTQIEGAVVSVVNLLGKLAEAQQQTEAKVNELTTRIGEMAEAQRQTNERLDVLINVVERYFSNRRNGKPQNLEDTE